MTFLKVTALSLLGIIALFALGWAVQGSNFFMYKVFAPKYEEVRHDVFKHSQSFIDGKITHLSKLELDHASASSDTHRCAIRSMALREIATVKNTEQLPRELISWTSKLRGDKSCN